MNDFIYGEVELFVVCLILGGVLALIYDGLRIFRMLLPHCEPVVDVEDFIFWLFTAWMVFRTMFYYNRGALRGYAFLGMFLGVIVYSLTVSRLLLFLAGRLVPCFQKVGRGISKPFRYMGRSVIKMLKKAVSEVKMAVKGR